MNDERTASACTVYCCLRHAQTTSTRRTVSSQTWKEYGRFIRRQQKHRILQESSLKARPIGKGILVKAAEPIKTSLDAESCCRLV